ncbi:MAG: zinc ABC transporter substrate-binding protein [Acidimicrobiia bacterium]|nr:zinc ABC transporter substrate-binding protein [Acidimicrobiia bacterium]
MIEHCRQHPWLVALAVVSVFVAAACSSDVESSPDRIRVVATTTIWGDVVGQLVGDDADVEVLMPVGVDPHDFQASSRQIAAIQDADLIVANGLGLEESLDDVLDNAAADGANVLRLAPDLDPIEFGHHGGTPKPCHPGTPSTGEHEETVPDDHDDHDHGSCDPHVWMDPLRVSAATGLIGQALEALDPTIDWRTRVDAYRAELDVVDAEMTRLLDVVATSDRILITTHDSLGYFGTRLGYRVVAVVIPGGSTLGDPSAATLAEIVDTMERTGVRTIFSETTVSDRLAQAVAAELGDDVDVVELWTGSLGGPGSGAEHVTDMLVADARLVADALAR